MMRVVHHLPDLGHAHAALVARLALHSAFPAPAIEYFRRMLDKYPAADFLAALDQVLAELAAEGCLPHRPSGLEARSVSLLYEGLCDLVALAEAPARVSYQPLLAA